MKTSNKAPINEIFTSIQGEGLYIGEKQQFIRFCGCNLSCNYCDTNHTPAFSLTPQELKNRLSNFTISLTGGEPLLHAEFLKEFLSLTSNKIYLETNGTLPDKLLQIIDFVDVVAQDIKIESATAQKNDFQTSEKFLKIALEAKKEAFLKVVFDFKITEEEIKNICQIASKHNVLLVLQPKMPLEKNFIEYFNIHDKFLKLHQNTRLIGQTHKFFNVP